jgi:serine O-acetyltransferase
MIGSNVDHIRSSLRAEEICRYTISQLNAFYPDERKIEIDDVMPAVPEVMRRLQHCFSYIENKYFFDGHRAVFNHLHSDQYAMWLYLLSNELFLQGAESNICSKLFLLNKQLNACDIFYEVNLPAIFLLVHPLGTVLGRGEYSDFFVAYQRCGIGSNNDVYPTLGKYLTMRPGSSILGASTIGDNCQIGAESLVIDSDIQENSLVFGNPSSQKLRQNHHNYPLWRKT